MQPLLCPTPLQPGDKVRIIAPAGAVPQAALSAGLRLIQQAGLVPIYDVALLSRHRYFAGSDRRRQGELLEALREPGSRAIWAARGGYGTARLLQAVRSDLIQQHNKWLIGFSDLTGLHAVFSEAGVVSLHGANVTTLSQWSAAARERLFALLLQPGAFGQRALDAGRWVQSFAGTASGGGPKDAPPPTGRLWGGNLTVLASLCGTGQLPENTAQEPLILLIEDIGEAPYRLDRCWHQLQAAGALRGVVGVAIGQLTQCEAEDADYTGLDMLTSAIELAGLPWLAGLPFGHGADAEAVPLGAVAQLELRACRLAVAL